jgi:cytochrome c-type biogenesis protein CcmH/NrfG
VLAACLLGGCAAAGPSYIPKSPFLDVPLSMRARDMQQRIADLEIQRDWAAIAAIAGPLVAQDPQDVDWRVVLGYAELQQNRAREAIAALAPVVERSPEDVDGHNLLGDAQRMAGDMDRARQTLERASFAHPNSSINRYLLGELYLQDNLLERARTAYAAAVRLDPEFSLGWLGLVRVLARIGPREDYDQALKRLAGLDAAMAKTAPAFQAQPLRR